MNFLSLYAHTYIRTTTIKITKLKDCTYVATAKVERRVLLLRAELARDFYEGGSNIRKGGTSSVSLAFAFFEACREEACHALIYFCVTSK